jgi:transposase
LSLQPRFDLAIPEDTQRVALAAFPKATLCRRIADELGPLYCDDQFANHFPTRGQPAACPARLALVSVLQYVEGLSDRQAADAVRGRIAGKYALGLGSPHWDSPHRGLVRHGLAGDISMGTEGT